MIRAAVCAAVVAAAVAVEPAAGQQLPQNNIHAVAAESRFAEEPSYYVTPVVVEKGESAPEGERFAEMAASADEMAEPAAAAPTAAPHFPHDVVPGAGGYQMKPGPLFNPGYYHPPTLPFRFPSYPYDNPSYTPFPSNWNVMLPKPWRSDALNIYSDGGRYMQNMAHFDSYPVGGGVATQQQQMY